MDGEEAVGFIHGTGHGVGLAIHEAPSLTAAPGRLRAGHVVTVEPGLYDPKAGGVRIEDTVVVTKTGWRYLAPCEKRLEV
jgi:Xaa-Pro aminopeptidase